MNTYHHARTHLRVFLTLSAAVGCTSQHSSEVPLHEHTQEVALEQTQGNPRVIVPQAEETLAQLRREFRRCFASMEASGKLSLRLTIAPQGEVTHAHATGPVPREVARCVEGRARRTLFAARDGKDYALLKVPVAVYRQ